MALSIPFIKKGECKSVSWGLKNFLASSKFVMPRCTKIPLNILFIFIDLDSSSTVFLSGSILGVQRFVIDLWIGKVKKNYL
jgi:hypothetical protein